MKLEFNELDASVHFALHQRLSREYGEVSATNFLLETLLEGAIAQRDQLAQQVASLEAANAELIRRLAELKDGKKKVEP